MLRLAGAQNLDVQIARQRLAEAEAADTSATLQFLPWLSPALGYRGHGGNTQDVAGNIVDVDKHSYTAGLALTAQLDLGDAIYRKLSAQQVHRAAEQSVGAQERDSTLSAATAYLELVRARAHADVVRESVAISRAYQDEVRRAVEIGLAGKGDELRVQVQTQRYEIELRRAVEQGRSASSRLAEVLHLDPATPLTPADAAPVPLTLVAADATPRVSGGPGHRVPPRAAAESGPPGGRGEDAGRRQLRSARADHRLPGLRGRPGRRPEWKGGHLRRIGRLRGRHRLAHRPGRPPRQRAGSTRRRPASRPHGSTKCARTTASCGRSADAFERAHSLADQIAAARGNLETASRALDLSQARKQFGVGAVLEVIQAQRDLTQARADYVDALAESGKAQYALAWATGAQGLTANAPPSSP